MRNTDAGAAVDAIIFDLDGTLIDSEENYFQADCRLLQEYGIAFTRELKRPFVGGGNLSMMRKIRAQYDLPATPEELLEKKNRHYIAIARENTVAFPEMVALVRALQKRGLKLAVASGSSPEVIRELLAIVGLDDAFSVLVSSEEVAGSKPQPDVFLEAARRLEVDPTRAVVLEDAPAGVVAGLAAGMRVVAIPFFPEPPLNDIYARAHLLFENGMPGFSATRVLEWLGL